MFTCSVACAANVLVLPIPGHEHKSLVERVGGSGGGKIEDIPLSSALYTKLAWGLGRAPYHSVTFLIWLY